MKLKNLTTFRRQYVDDFLSRYQFYGKVLDLGGKKVNKRGNFTPCLKSVDEWLYLNVDEKTQPDVLASAEDVPFENFSFDIILMAEVLEHLENPSSSLQEAYRLLKKNGSLVITMPFLYPYHGDPCDFQRWTNTKIEKELRTLGFDQVKVFPMGGVVAVAFDLVRNYACKKWKKSSRLFKVLLPLVKFFEDRIGKDPTICTGWYVEAVKKG